MLVRINQWAGPAKLHLAHETYNAYAQLINSPRGSFGPPKAEGQDTLNYQSKVDLLPKYFGAVQRIDKDDLRYLSLHD